jgi:hypothetical protein
VGANFLHTVVFPKSITVAECRNSALGTHAGTCQKYNSFHTVIYVFEEFERFEKFEMAKGKQPFKLSNYQPFQTLFYMFDVAKIHNFYEKW